MVLILLLPMVLAEHPSTQPAPSVPGSKIVFVDRAKEYIKTPYGQSFVRKTVDNRRSRYRTETYKMGGDVGLFEKPSEPVSIAAPEGYFGYGINQELPRFSSVGGVFRNFKLIYGVDTQVIKGYDRSRWQ